MLECQESRETSLFKPDTDHYFFEVNLKAKAPAIKETLLKAEMKAWVNNQAPAVKQEFRVVVMNNICHPTNRTFWNALTVFVDVETPHFCGF